MKSPQQAVSKNLEREARIALCTLKVVPLHVMFKSEPFPVLRRLGKIWFRQGMSKVCSHFANPSTSSDLAVSAVGGSDSDAYFLLEGGMVVVFFERDQTVWMVLVLSLVFCRGLGEVGEIE